MSTEENKAIIRRFVDELWRKGNLDIINELCAPDLVVHKTGPGLPPTREGFRQFIATFILRKSYSNQVSQLDDYILAAKEQRFVAPGFPLRDLTNYLKGDRIDNRFRPFRYLKSETPIRLLNLLKDTPDDTPRYLSEIHRLEQLNLKRYDYVYPVRKMRTGFSWDIAPLYMGMKK